jgi:hypothetical protein
MYNDQNGVPVPIYIIEGSSEPSRILYEDNLAGATIEIKVRGGLELSSAASNADGSVTIIPPSGGVSFSEIQMVFTTAGQAKTTRAGTRASLFINGTPIVSLLLTLIPWDRLDAFAETPPASYIVQSNEQTKTLVIPVGRVGASLAWASITGKPTVFPTTSAQINDSTPAGRTLLTAADAPAQRTALSLGTAALQNVGAFEPAGAVAGEQSARAAADNALDGRLDIVEAAIPLKADLVGGKVPSGQLPALAIGETFTAANQAAMLALTAQIGDVAIRTDQGGQRYLLTGTASTLADWLPLNVPDAVSSVNGQTGAVVLGKADVGLANVDNTSDVNKPVSTAQQTALDGKSDVGHAHVIANITDWGTLPQIAVNASQTLPASARGSVVRINTAVGTYQVTLPTSANPGDWLITTKSSADTNRAIIQVGGVDVAWLSQQSDDVMWQWNGSAWVAMWVNIAPLRQIFTTTQVWNRPPLIRRLDIRAIGGGGGGGGGATGIATANRTGGGGGAGGYFNERSIDASIIPSLISVVVGAGGVGGAGGIVGGGAGTAGAAGGTTTVGDFVQAFGSPNGAGGLASGTTVAGGANGLGLGLFATNGGGAGNSTAGSPTTDNQMAAGGAGGGGLNTANAQAAGGVGARGGRMNTSGAGSATAGAVGGGAGGTGASVNATFPAGFLGGNGGGGGGASNVNTVAGGRGGDGGFPGGGGAGGGAALSGGTATGGRGGDGGAGAAELVSYF